MDSMDGALIDSQRLAESKVVDDILNMFRGAKNLKRVRAIAALAGERKYQESLHKKTGQDPISIPGELVLMSEYLKKAFSTYTDTFGDPGERPTMDVIRKITAIGLRAIENYGCPTRDIEGSLAARPPEHRAASDYPVPADQVEEKGGLLQLKEPDKLEEMCAHPDLRENADCQVCEIGGCEFDRRPGIQEPTTPPVEDISEADISEADVSKDDSQAEFLQKAWDNDLAEECAHPDLRMNAGCQACGMEGCEFDRRLEPK